jgi:hypothetical protein
VEALNHHIKQGMQDGCALTLLLLLLLVLLVLQAGCITTGLWGAGQHL